MESPSGDEGIVVQHGAEKYVDDDVDCPDEHVGGCHFFRLSQDIPEQENVQGHGGGNYSPGRRAETFDTVSEQAYKTTDGERSKDVDLFVDQEETEPPG
jgi:hypothetical protein